MSASLSSVTGAPRHFVPAAPALQDNTTTEQALEDALLSRAANTVQTPLQIQILTFYSARNFVPAWSGNDAADTMAASIQSHLAAADEQGLRASDYLGATRELPPPESAAEAARFDLALTEALFRYASHLSSGRTFPGDVYKDVRLPVRNLDIAALLTAAMGRADIEAFFSGLPPPHSEYQALVRALARYRAIVSLGGWPSVPDNSGIALGDNNPRTKILIQRLAFEDSLIAGDADFSESDVQQALLRYQLRTGLEVTGKLDAETRRELNVSPAVRIGQIEANMERWRWLPRKFEDRYVRVNVPDQSLDLIENGAVALHSRVIIGKKSSPTPILRTEVVAVVANPPWDIPDDIAARQLLPHLRQSANYLAARNFNLVDGPAADPQGAKINWRRVPANRLPYQIQQPPGPDNVLGRFMLDSPNDFDVYLHDTPSKKLFAQAVREASNGCVRVEEISSLAALALDGDRQDALEAALISGETHGLPLSHPLPVYMLYWTATAEPDGTIGFRPDRYGRDSRLLAKMTGTGLAPKARPKSHT